MIFINIKKLVYRIPERTAKIAVAVLTIIFVLIILFMLLSRFSQPTPVETTTYAMGSYIQQKVYGKNAQDAAQSAANAAASLEDLISWRKEGSDIANINQNAGIEWTQVSKTTENILNQSLEVCKASDGALDITIAPLSELWNFDEEPTEPPSDSLIKKLLSYVDYSKLRYNADDCSYSFKSSGYAVDLGAVGKGAACDVMVSEYKAADIDYAIVAVGGSIGTYGTKPGGKKWTIAVRNPKGEGTIGTLDIDSGFVSTSGSYEKYFEYDGKLYHHILDPETGYPKETEVVSVTILCDTGTISDALSTACFNLGWDKSQAVLEQFGADAVFVYSDGTVRITEGMKDIFKLTDKEYSLAGG